MIAGQLELIMFSNVARIAADMAKAQNLVGNAVATIEKGLAAIGVGFSAHALIEKINSVVDAMDKLKESSEKTGGSVENLSKLKFFSDLSGSSVEGLTGALVKLSKGESAASNETAAFSQALKFLGLNAKDSEGNLKTADVLYGEIAKKLFEYQDGAGKAAIAVALMGKSGADQLPTMKKMIELGEIEASTTTAQAEQAEAYKVEVARLNHEKEILWNTVSGSLLPTMTDFVTVLLNASRETDSLSSKAKAFASDNSMQTWAQETGLFVAQMIDVLRAMGSTVIAIVASVKTGMADVEVFTRTMNLLDPVKVAAQLAAGQHPVDELKAAIEREGELARIAREALANVFSDSATAMADSYTERIAKTNAFNAAMKGLQDDFVAASKEERDALDLLYGEAEKKPLNFALGDAKLEAAELKLYQNAMKSLQDQLGALNQQTELEKITEHLYGIEIMDADGKIIHITGSLERLGRARADNVQQVAAEIDVLKQRNMVYEAWAKRIVEIIALAEKEWLVLSERRTANARQISDIEFETKLLKDEAPLAQAGLLTKAEEIRLISQVRLQRELDNSDREIEKKLRADLIALGDIETAQQREKAEQLMSDAETQKLAARLALVGRSAAQLQNDLAKLAADRTWVAGVRGAFNDYVDNATNTGKLVREALSRGFTALEDTVYDMIRHTKFSFGGLIDFMKDALARLAAQQITLRIVGTIGTSLGLTGAANAAGGALSAAGSGMNILSGGNTIYNVASGNSWLSGIFGGGAPVAGTVGAPAVGELAGLTMTQAPVYGAGGELLSAAVFGEAVKDGAASGIAGALGAIPAWGWIAAGGLLAYGLFSGGKETVQGSGSASISPGGTVERLTGQLHGGYDPTAVMNLSAQTVQKFADIVAQLGGTISRRFGVGIGQGGGGEYNVVPDIAGRQLADKAGLDAAGAQLEAVRAMMYGLQQAADFPEYIKKVFAAIDAGTASAEQINSAVEFAAKLKTIHENLSETRPAFQILTDAADDLKEKLGTSGATFKTDFLAAIEAGITPEALADWEKLAGLLDNVNATVASFAADQASLVDHFSSPAQKLATAQEAINAAAEKYGVVAPQNAAQLREIVAGLDKTNPAHQQLITELKALSPAFDLVFGSMEDFTQITADVASTIDSFKTPAQQYAAAQAAINAMVAKYNYQGPVTVAMYTAILGSINTSTEAGAAFAKELLGLAGSFDLLASKTAMYSEQRVQHEWDAMTPAQQQASDQMRLSSFATAYDYSGPQTIDMLNLVESGIDLTTAAGIAWYEQLETLRPALERTAERTLAVEEAQRNTAITNDALSDRIAVLSGQRTQKEISRELQMAEAERNLGVSTDATTLNLIRQTWAQEDLSEATAGAADLWNRFATPAQQMAKATADVNAVFEEFGIAVPQSGEALANLINGLDLTDPAMQRFVNALLGLGNELDTVIPKVNSVVKTFDQLDSFAMAKTRFETLMSGVGESIRNLSGGDYGKEMSDTWNFLNSQIPHLRARQEEIARSGGFGTPEYAAIGTEIVDIENKMRELQTDMTRYAQFEAQIPGHGKDLLELQRWYDEQRALYEGNEEALTIIEADYQQRRRDIINTANEELLRQQQQLLDWLKGNALDQNLSPLTAQQKLVEAQRQYAERLRLAQEHDPAAMADITRYADALLAAEKAVYGFGGDYSAMYAQVRADIESIVDSLHPVADPGITQVSTNIIQLRSSTEDMKEVLARLQERTIEKLEDIRIEVVDAINSSGNRQAAATAAAAVLHKRA
jgi:lambda family phage tail tape measure protein